MNKTYLTQLKQLITRRLTDTWHSLAVIAVLLALITNASPLTIPVAGLLFLIFTIFFLAVDRSRETKKLKPNIFDHSKASPKQEIKSPLYIAITDALTDPIILLDQGNHLVHANQQAKAIFQINGQGQDISAIIRNPELIEAINQVTINKSAKTIKLQERVPIERHFDVNITWIAKNKDDKPALVIHFHDLTEQERLNRMRADFIANASHELRTPLASVLGCIDTLRGAAKNDAAAQEKFLSLMASQGKRMTGLIDDLLSLSRVEMDAHRQAKEKVDIIALLSNTVDSLRSLADEQNIKLNLEYDEDDLIAIGDSKELAQVFQNLIHNAIKYGQTSGATQSEVNIKISKFSAQPNNAKFGNPQSDKIHIEIEDHGIGIEPIHLPRLTERFYRVDVEQSRQKGGTGLGLAIVKHILTHHRGDLKIRSKAGEGSTFTVILPKF